MSVHMCLCVWCVWCMKVHTYAQAVKVRCLPQLVSNTFWGLSLSLNLELSSFTKQEGL